MTFKVIKYSLLIGLTCACVELFSQQEPVLKLVNPLIGTTKTKINSLWGGEGGTYPGAVAPFGIVQLTPETRITEPNGYDYRDSTIYWFSCVNHLSGYPNGSSGQIKVMPVSNLPSLQIVNYRRLFSHRNEKSEAGYYRVRFSDDGTLVETTAAVHSGMFRFTFPPKIKPRLFIADLGKIEIASKRIIKGDRLNAIISLNADFIDKEAVADGCFLTFAAANKGKTEIIMKIGVSQVSLANSEMNLKAEAQTWDFDQFKKINQQKWNNALSLIDVEDTSRTNKTIFYTALYHSMLIPWIISDVDGSYKGAHGETRKTKGENEYGVYSPWDTFRSLHPLLTLILPDRQKDMVQSMLDQYEQTGKLPKGPMTGNHIIPIIVDSYLKGINGIDSSKLFSAMKASIEEPSRDFAAYINLGYVPSTLSESVTQTVEYAYDDWALAQFAGMVMKDQTTRDKLLKRSFNYRNLFNTEELALLPRDGDQFNLSPGNSGYKEGDQWSYSLFVPHNPRDLINLMGGDQEFTSHLDSALKKQIIVFDNEPVLHVPWFFNYAHHPEESQKWVRKIMRTHYINSPDGLPGNDDLGSMSSWYVFSAMGFYPFCPGRPVYDLGAPLFKKITVHFKNGKSMIINSVNNSNENYFVKKTLLNGMVYNKLWISHTDMTKGGELTFMMQKSSSASNPVDSHFEGPSETKGNPDFLITDFHSTQSHVEPDKSFFIKFTVKNRGSKGTKLIKVNIDGKDFFHKNILVDENSSKNDSIECRLYPIGKRSVIIDDSKLLIEVVAPLLKTKMPWEITELKCKTIYKKDLPLIFYYKIKNKSGFRDTVSFQILTDQSPYEGNRVMLEPGETKTVESQIIFKTDGLHELNVGQKTKKIKIYSEAIDSKVIDLNMMSKLSQPDTIPDLSFLSNHGLIRPKTGQKPISVPFKTGINSYIEFNNSESLDHINKNITVMAWVKPGIQNKGLTDIISKGDFIVMQSIGNKSLSFFAGGWGRGSCTVDLPANWVNNWHHIAGVSDGMSLKIFIDGVESGKTIVNAPVSLSSPARWMLGRNEEFPEERIFDGYFDQFKIFVEPLSGIEIKEEMLRGQPKNEKDIKINTKGFIK